MEPENNNEDYFMRWIKIIISKLLGSMKKVNKRNAVFGSSLLDGLNAFGPVIIGSQSSITSTEAVLSQPSGFTAVTL